MSSTPERDSIEQQLSDVSARLGLADTTVEITRVRLDKLRSVPELEDKPLTLVAATTLALSCREDGAPVTVGEIAQAWSETLEEGTIEQEEISSMFGPVAQHLEIQGTPPQPRAIIERFGSNLDMPDPLIVVANHLLEDLYEKDPELVAKGPAPSSTAAAALFLAAQVNEYGGIDENSLSDTAGTGQLSIRNHAEQIQETIGRNELANNSRYHAVPEEEAPEQQAESEPVPTGADGGNAAEEPADATEPEPEPDERDDEAESEDTDEADEADADEADETEGSVTVEAVQEEIDALAEGLDLDASLRVFARGLVSDVVDDLPAESAEEMAGATVLAASRIQDVDDLIAADIAAEREFEPRLLFNSLDTLSGSVEMEIPTEDLESFVDRLIEELGLDDAVKSETMDALDQSGLEGDAGDYTPAELAAGGLYFAGTIGGAAVDPEELGSVVGADPEYVTHVRNDILTSLSLLLVRGDLDYEETSWTVDLLELDLEDGFDDPAAENAVAIAKTYVSGRESQAVDDVTIDTLRRE
jgi:transcription initiation factor TFIIIB Brf1 subunit/transcription initiation factor TFIIB